MTCLQGGVCAAFIDINQRCDESDRCADVSASCVAGFCRCGDDFFARDGACVRKIPLYQRCTAAVDICADVNAACRDNQCLCLLSHFDLNGVCVLRGQIGTPCLRSGLCTQANVICDDVTDTCVCSERYYADDDRCVLSRHTRVVRQRRAVR